MDFDLSTNINITMFGNKIYFFPQQVLELLKFPVVVVLEHRDDYQLVPRK